MFTHLLPDDEKVFSVFFCEHAERHFLKRFRKDYRGKQWQVTEDSIRQDLSRISNGTNDLQKTQQIDELWHDGDIWVFKYDFRIAKTNVSAKASGNRVVGVLNIKKNRIDIAVIYGKTDLPKNMGETQFIKSVVREIFPNIGWR
jgi:hypothetical protein